MRYRTYTERFKSRFGKNMVTGKFPREIKLPVIAIKTISNDRTELFTFYDPVSSRATFPPCLKTRSPRDPAPHADDVHASAREKRVYEFSHRMNITLFSLLCMNDRDVNKKVSFDDRVRFLIYSQKNSKSSPMESWLNYQGSQPGLRNLYNDFKDCDEIESNKAFDRRVARMNQFSLPPPESPSETLLLSMTNSNRVLVIPLKWRGMTVSMYTLKRHVEDRICFFMLIDGGFRKPCVAYVEKVESVSNPRIPIEDREIQLKCIILMGVYRQGRTIAHRPAYVEHNILLSNVDTIVQTSADIACGGAFWFRGNRGREEGDLCPEKIDDVYIGKELFKHNFITKYAAGVWKDAELDFEINMNWLELVKFESHTPSRSISILPNNQMDIRIEQKDTERGWLCFTLEEILIFRNKERSTEIDELIFDQVTEQELYDYCASFLKESNLRAPPDDVMFVRRKYQNDEWSDLRGDNPLKKAHLVYIEQTRRNRFTPCLAVIKCASDKSHSSVYKVFRTTTKSSCFDEHFQKAGHAMLVAVKNELNSAR